MPLMGSVTTLLASGARSSSDTGLGNVIRPNIAPSRAVFQLKVTQVPSSSAFSSGTLDVFINHSVDGVVYDSFVHFTQVTAAVANVASIIASWNGKVAASSSQNMHTASTSAMAAGYVLNGAVGGYWKVGYTIANGPAAATSSTFSFAVIAQLGE